MFVSACLLNQVFFNLIPCSTSHPGTGVKHFAGCDHQPADWSRCRAAAADTVARQRRPWQRRCASPSNGLRLPRRRQVSPGGVGGSPADVGGSRARWRGFPGVRGSRTRWRSFPGVRWKIHNNDRGMPRL